MKPPLYKKFHLLKTALSDSEYQSAETLLRELADVQLPPRAYKLFTHLDRKYTRLSGEKIEFGATASPPNLEPERPDGLLSMYDDRELHDGVSLVSCCMNRNDNLKKSLQSWLELPVQEIVIVDWNSTDPVSTTISGINDERIKIVRVENEPHWILTYGFNVGLRFASYKKVYKLDADIIVTPDFLEKNTYAEGEFIRGNEKLASERNETQQLYINGSFGASKNDLSDIGFYNEFIRTYGWDDTDLYRRLSLQRGLGQKFLAFDSLSHSHQEQEERLRHQDVPKTDFINRFPATEFTNICNKLIVSLWRTWDRSFLQDYRIKRSSPNHWVCQRTTVHREVPESLVRDATKYAVIEHLQKVSPLWAQKARDTPWMAEFIHRHYEKGIPFEETASLLLLEGTADAFFAKGPNPRALLESQDPIKKHDKCKMFAIEGLPCRAEVSKDGKRLIFQGLESDDFSRIKSLHKRCGHLDLFSNSIKTPATAEPGESGKLERVLAISLYDEPNNDRVREYMDCFERNLGFFDSLAIFYEESDGNIFKLANSLCSKHRNTSKASIYWISIDKRPTFEQIFTTVDFLFPDTLAFVANADIAFDETSYEVHADSINDSFIALSRVEAPSNRGDNGGFIMNHYGLPNAWSADAWIYRTPLKLKFRADFPIGAFHCDSFLNYYIGKSGYKLFNPCLSVNAIHIHNELYNASDFKKQAHSNAIETSRLKEAELCDGEVPIRGVQWCRIKDVTDGSRADYLLQWRNFVINIFMDEKADNFISALIIAIMSLKLGDHIEGGIGVSLNIPYELAESETGDILFTTLHRIGNSELTIAITNSDIERPFVEGPSGCLMSSPSVEELINAYLACYPDGKGHNIFDSGIVIDKQFGRRMKGHSPFISLYFSPDQHNDLDTYILLKCLQGSEMKLLTDVLHELAPKHDALQPFRDELLVAKDCTSEPSGKELIEQIKSGGDSGKSPDYALTYISSIYNGDEYFKGFLENIAASAIENKAEVILVDANSPGNEREVFDRFIREYPGLNAQFKYVTLQEDPGLYDCWKIAIELASSELISNANLDDRRSPFQSAALIHTLNDNPQVAGAATALRVTTDKNSPWYSSSGNEYWFVDDGSTRIDFDSLYSRNENDQIISINRMHCMPVWRKSLHQKYGFFDESRYGTSADWAFWLECTRNGEIFELVQSALSLYMKNEASHNRIHDAEGNMELKIIKDYLSDREQAFIQQ